jgi:hypothetical protein
MAADQALRITEYLQYHSNPAFSLQLFEILPQLKLSVPPTEDNTLVYLVRLISSHVFDNISCIICNQMESILLSKSIQPSRYSTVLLQTEDLISLLHRFVILERN